MLSINLKLNLTRVNNSNVFIFPWNSGVTLIQHPIPALPKSSLYQALSISAAPPDGYWWLIN